MNKFSLVLVFMMTFFALNAQKLTKVVGKMEGSKPVLTIDKAITLKSFNKNLLRMSSIDGKFTTVDLISIGGNNYALVFSGKVYKSSLLVVSDGKVLKALVGTSCTSSGCSQEKVGCVPKYAAGSDYGTCTPCSNGEKCTKTVTDESLLD